MNSYTLQMIAQQRDRGERASRRPRPGRAGVEACPSESAARAVERADRLPRPPEGSPLTPGPAFASAVVDLSHPATAIAPHNHLARPAMLSGQSLRSRT